MPRCPRPSRATIEMLEQRQLLTASLISTGPGAPLIIGSGARQMEYLDRGLVAVNKTTTSVYMSWRLLVTDPSTVGFNVYRSVNGGAATKLNGSVITTTTDFTDTTVNEASINSYFVKAVISNVEQSASPTYTIPAGTGVQEHIDIPLSPPPNPVLPDGSTYTYNANDASTGDLDGDGKYEIILKWDPSDSHDSSQDGFTGFTYFDAYKLDGTRLWRINLGQNVRAGAHDTQFMVYDFDGDGKAEIVARTAPGTIDGQGNPVLLPGDRVTDDYRNATTGRINTGPEYLTVFNGQTGAAITTVPFLPDRVNISSWGDDYGNRGNRFLMAVAYLDGVHPSLVVGRGIFPEQSAGHAVRNEVTAWDFNGTNLALRWWFRAVKNASAYGLPDQNTTYIGQGNYEMQIADVDGDGRDEIIYGSMTINDNGQPLYSTQLGHGDALAVSDMIPSHPGEEVYMPMESPGSNGHITTNVHDAATGAILFDTFTTPPGSTDPDVGRGNAMDIDPNYPGFEVWDAYNPSIYNAAAGTIIQAKPSNMMINFGIWWDADPLRELLDGTTISDWRITGGVGARSNYVSSTTGAAGSLNNTTGLSGNNGTKNTPCLVADLLGDWREEVVWRKSDNTALQIWTTTIPATNRMDTLMEDTQYRESVAWQNVGYNQPTATSFFLGAANAAGAFPTIPVPNIYLVQASAVGPVPPTGLNSTPISISQVNLLWNPVAGATGYNIRRRENPTDLFTTIAGNVLGTTYSDQTAFGGTSYTYEVSATNAGGEGGVSNASLVTTPAAFTFQAENGTFGGSTGYGFSNSGFHGIGYLDLHQSGDFFELANVYADTGGSERIRFRYSLAGVSSVNASAIINGVATPVTFTPTGGGSNWSTLELTATMQQRFANTVRLELTSDGSISLDELQVNVTDTLPPVVSSTNFLFATQHAIEIQFDEDVNSSTVNATDLVLHPLPGGSDIVPNGVSYNNLTHTATFTFASFLAEGNYQAVLGNGSVSDLTGHALSGDYAFSVFFLEGDANHDRTVDIKDLMILSPNLGQSLLDFSKGDFNYDGVINDVDLGILASRWQTTLSPPIPAAPATTSIAARRTATRAITSMV